MMKLQRIPEPLLTFAYQQAVADPRDGLSLFGPLDPGKVYGMRAGVIGTKEGIAIFRGWIRGINNAIGSAAEPQELLYRPTFPGFSTAFRIPWNPEPNATIEINGDELSNAVHLQDRHQRVYNAVSLFESAILNDKREGETNAVDVWFVIVPPDVKRLCSPRSKVMPGEATAAPDLYTAKEAKQLRRQPGLFGAVNKSINAFDFEPHFHNQLKARLLTQAPPLQIIQEDTLAPERFLGPLGRPRRKVDKPSTIAWNLCTTAYYKATGRPWRLSRVRNGVCYLGLVFKRDERSFDSRNACCAAQMFLDSGHGVVFKGAIGQWYSPDSGFHLDREGARQVVTTALNTYRDLNRQLADGTDTPPQEMFIHGRTDINDDEWAGFQDAAGSQTKLVYVKITQSDFKIYGRESYPLPRGTVLYESDRSALLWTVGYVPRLRTYIGKEVPRPFYLRVARGEADIHTVAADVLALTKLNFNACIFADGQPVTLRFADDIGEILTAAPLDEKTEKLPLHFRFYI
jgi:hypothetical protein